MIFFCGGVLLAILSRILCHSVVVFLGMNCIMEGLHEASLQVLGKGDRPGWGSLQSIH